MANPIRNYILNNKKSRQGATELKGQGEPYGRGISESTTDSDSSQTKSGPRGGKAAGGSGIPAPPPAPPPPPTLIASKVVTKKGTGIGSGAGGEGDLISDLRKFQEGEKALKKVKLDDEELAKRGQLSSGLEFSLRHTEETQEEIENGKTQWISDQRGFIDTVHNTLLSSYDMMNIVFQIIDQQELEWKEALKLFDKIADRDPDRLAPAMLDIGFSLKYFLNDGDKQYTTIFCNTELPTFIILNVMQMVLSANGSNRQGGAMTSQDINSVRDGGSVVRGYWAKKEPPKKEILKKEPPKDVIKGYWAKKDTSVSGSLFDGEETPAPAQASTPASATSAAPAPAAASAAKPTYGRRKENIQVGSLFDND